MDALKTPYTTSLLPPYFRKQFSIKTFEAAWKKTCKYLQVSKIFTHLGVW
jgi:hypothetical protein